MLVNKEEYFRLLSKINPIPFEQSQAWIENNHSQDSANIIYIVNSTEDIRICCTGIISKKKFFGSKLNIKGVCRKRDVNETELRKFFVSIVELDYDFVSIWDGERYDSDFELAIRRAGFIRPLGLSLSPMTMYVDLKKEFSFHRNWRRNVKKSIANGNTFHKIDLISEKEANDFVSLFKEQSQRKGLSYGFTDSDIIKLSNDDRYHMFMVANKDGKNIAGRMVFVSENMAYDVYAANSDEGIKSGGVYQVQEGMLNFLKTTSAEFFDYGLIPPRADEMDDIYLAKSYSGGYAVGLNSEWFYGKSQIAQFLLSFKIFCIYKKRMY